MSDTPRDNPGTDAEPETAPATAPFHGHRATRRDIARGTALAAVAAAALLILVVLPAEYGIDLTGFGAATGLGSIATAAPPPANATAATHQPQAAAFRSDTVNITVPAGRGLEYKFRLREGDALLYAWTATGPLTYDFHGEPQAGPPGYFQSYEEGLRFAANGSFAAPFEGIHGWYWRNDGARPVVVTLHTAGFYGVLGRL